MTPATPTAEQSMSSAQFYALASADDTGRLAVTDRRTLHALARRGWVYRQRVRKKSWWVITDSGRAAYQNSPRVRPPRVRPHWPSYWDVQRLAHAWYLAEGHEIIRPAHGMLWRVLCPATSSDEPLGHCDTLAEAVELLVQHHLHHCTCAPPLSNPAAPESNSPIRDATRADIEEPHA
ncbi:MULTISPECIES: hypothetical protein [unclassified Nocardia]|uniref:hypothetical protein n=1 Tax=unclassified Nocardia TaxID=2637762 RepID=UPI001CE4A38B|nr:MULTISPECIES: hypothetical protein [unclassified Nocardia]